ncbi:MAG: CHAT domain-containing protein, partial [Candidatus Eisenbacteria sp.]|nr:CHAT domain-containing protein [Candidatus Eisenbacteria bacterium]
DPLEAAMAGTRIYDGLLTAKEIVREWDLNADLVTLSACETGLGKKVMGEGYVGFAHAFFQAGARSLLVSLWKVEDKATSLLMRRFYENWLGEYTDERIGLPDEAMPKAEALREAKRWLRDYIDEYGNRPYEHPYYWSAFILIGDRS